MKTQVTLSEFLARLDDSYGEFDLQKSRRVLRATIGLLNVLLNDPDLDLDKPQLDELMIRVRTVLNYLPPETTITRHIALRTDPGLCREWPVQCGATCT